MMRFESGEHIDIGNLNPDETEVLAREVLRELSEERRFSVLEAALTKEEKQELSEVWFNIFKDKGRHSQ